LQGVYVGEKGIGNYWIVGRKIDVLGSGFGFVGAEDSRCSVVSCLDIIVAVSISTSGVVAFVICAFAFLFVPSSLLSMSLPSLSWSLLSGLVLAQSVLLHSVVVVSFSSLSVMIGGDVAVLLIVSAEEVLET